MAVDTAAKRYSMENFANPIITPLIIPDGVIAANDRTHFLSLYSGIVLSGGDITAPILSSPTGVATGTTTANGTVSTDEGNGTLYWVVTQSATTPSTAQIQAGQNHLGAAADDNGSQAVSATGVQNVAGTGLTASTTYYFHYQHQDAATNDSTAMSSASFTTSPLSSGLAGTMGLLGVGA